MKVLLGVLLAAASIEDIRRQKIPGFLCISLGVMVICRVIIIRNGTWQEYMTGLVPGMVMLLLAYVTKEKVGYGDGFVLLLLGLLQGIQICILQLGLALFAASLFSTFLLVTKKGTGKTTIPFLPFLFIAYILVR